MSSITETTSLETLKIEFFNRMKDRAPNTLSEYRRSINRLYKFMSKNGLKDIEKLTERDIREFQLYLFGIGNSATTIRYHIKALRRYCDFLKAWGLIKINPFKHCDIIPSPERIRRSKRYYSHQEVLRRYHNYLKKKYAHRIAQSYLASIRAFILYLEEKDIKSISSVRYKDIASYAEYLWSYRTPTGRNYTPSTIKDKLEDVKKLYRVFYLEELVDRDPAKRFNIREFLRERLPDTRPRVVALEKEKTIFGKLAIEFVSYLTMRGYVERTIKKYARELEIFFEWLATRYIKEPKEVTKLIIMDYHKEIHNFKGIKGGGWSISTRHNHLLIVHNFFRFLTRLDYIDKNPTEYIELPKAERGLPMALLKDSEARLILDSIDSSRELALRDRAIIELLYSSAIRANELCHLELGDIDFERRQIIIKHPKGGKSFERLVPFGIFAEKALREYLRDLRPELVKDKSRVVFLSKRGNMLYPTSLCELVKEYVRKAGIKNRITTHSFRVGCATEMLRNGADIRYVQSLLGHKRIDTTQIYTRVNIDDIKRVHKRFHPREKYLRKMKRFGYVDIR